MSPLNFLRFCCLGVGGRHDSNRTALRFAENLGHEEVACILRVDPAVSTIQEAAAAGSVHEVWALMRQVRSAENTVWVTTMMTDTMVIVEID